MIIFQSIVRTVSQGHNEKKCFVLHLVFQKEEKKVNQHEKNRNDDKEKDGNERQKEAVHKGKDRQFQEQRENNRARRGRYPHREGYIQK